MRVVAIDVRGSYGHFRKPYAPLSPVSFPFPPPPTVLGLVGAICGLGKDEYHVRLGWETARVGVRLLSPHKTLRAGLNLLNTKDGTDRYFRPSSPTKAHIQVPYEFLSDPHFRVYLAGIDDELLDELADRCREGTPAYTPTLGLANCLAAVSLFRDEVVERTVDRGETLGVIPVGDHTVVDLAAGRPFARLRVPATMDPTRRVRRYQEVAVALDTGPVEVQGVERWQWPGETFTFI